jgi:ABC-type dipeptide/oligopeptide/nickel transport system permease subunit
MSEANVPHNNLEIAEHSFSEFRRFIRVFLSRKVVAFGTFIILILIFNAIFAPVITPYDPYKVDTKKALQQPSMEHFLGTDQLGRDTLSRLIYGSQVLLQVGIIAVVVAATIGMFLGLVAGYVGGWPDRIIMRLMDALMAIPSIMLALAIAAMLGGGIRNVMIALGITLTPVYCRIMFGQILSIKESDYIMAAIAAGASNLRVMFLHILPNCFPILIVLITINLGIAILTEAGLSFLGIGISPPGAAWGAMVSDGYRYLLTNPLLSFAPGVCIMLVVWSFNMVGDGLRDALDPRLRGTL